MVKGDSKTGHAARDMRLAEESFQAVLVGIGTLAQCYAALDEPKAAGAALRDYMDLVDKCDIPSAAQKARLVEFHGKVPPQAVWEKFMSIRSLVGDPLEVLSTSSSGDEAVEIEFKPSELQGASHGDLRPVP